VLGLLGEPSALSVLKVMRTDVDPGVRLQVAEAMWRLGSGDGLEALVGRQHQRLPRRPDDRHARLGRPAQPQRQPLRLWQPHDAYDEVNLVAARAMGMLGHDDGYAWPCRATAARTRASGRWRPWPSATSAAATPRKYLAKLLKDSEAPCASPPPPPC
jgi:hypothetical protein